MGLIFSTRTPTVKKNPLLYLLLCLLLAASTAKADDIATLRSFLDTKADDQAALHGVYMACLNLTRSGTEEAVPLLTQLLADERFSTVARTALVNMPGETGIKALRDSLQTLKGKHQIAVIQTLGAIRDKESVPALIKIAESAEEDASVEAACRALGEIATSDAVRFIVVQQAGGVLATQREKNDSPKWITEVTLRAAEQFRPLPDVPESGLEAYEPILRFGDGADKEAAILGILRIRNMPDMPRMRVFEEHFRIAQQLILELKSPDTGKIVLVNMSNLPIEQQAALVRNLGARKDSVAIVPQLIELANGDKPELQFAAVEALGEIGDLRAVDTLLLLAGTPVAELAQAATESLQRFQGDEFNKKLLALLDNDDFDLRLTILHLIGMRQIASASDRVKVFFDDPYRTMRSRAYRVFAQSAPATSENIHFVLEQLKGADEEEKEVLGGVLVILCRRATEIEKAVEVLKNADVETSDFYLDCLFALGGEKAAQALATVAMGTNDALTDKATQLLGRWTTPEVAPFLIEIAEKHPNERYRSRTLRGYLRVIRQMGLPVEQKVEMAEKAFAVAQTDADKEQAKEVLERFQAMMKETPIFDGKTFDGWEHIGDEKWFRIENGAIVGGSLEGGNPSNGFISTKKEYRDFTLYIECKAIGQGANGGVQFRSARTPTGGGMIGYQADMTATTQYWGSIYDENRRNRTLIAPPQDVIQRILRPNEWNEYQIVCQGNNIKVYLNGTLTVDYTETDANIPARGFIGLQIQSGATETWYRNIRIEEIETVETKGTPIFDGKTFDGWAFRGNEEWFRIADGAIVGGSSEKPIPRNEFVTSKKEYGDFTLYVECKTLGRGCNGGVQFRSVRAPADGNMPSEMIGYQADMTDTVAYWGALYDESRRNRFLAEPPKELMERIFRPNDWNDYKIVCKGNNVKIYLNGELTVDYTETDANIPARGFIGLQIHGGPPSETWYRNIRIEE